MRSSLHEASPLAVRALVLVALAFVILGSGLCSQPLRADTAKSAIIADSGTGHQQGPFTGNFYINELLGADRFYNAGYTGTASVMASIEAGYMWSGHETLTHVQQIPDNLLSGGEIDRHATWVGMLMGGRNGGTDPGPYQLGIAPDAELHTGAIATSWPTSSSFPRYTGSFNANFFSTTTYGPFRQAIQDGITGGGGTRTADVLNVSFNSIASNGITGNDQLSSVLDAMIFENPHTLLASAVGNTTPNGAGPNRVLSPATGYNNIAVASLSAANGYSQVSAFSNGGPNNYNDPDTGTVSQARQVVDIAAPGERLSTAYYGGETGGNGTNVFGPPDGPAGGPDYYTRYVLGTSFASPLVASGGALLHDAGYALFGGNPDAHDARVIKAVLMNSADKIPGWNNGQISHPNGLGGVQTSQGLDNRVGTGRMNLDAAFDQYLLGTNDVAGTAQGFLGEVDELGWDFGEVAEGTTNDYRLSGSFHEGSQVTATLTWFRNRTQVGSTGFSDNSYDNLDLEFWLLESNLPSQLISESISMYNSSEHFSFAVPQNGQYMLRVRWTGELFDDIGDANSAQYGLAWAVFSVPEPGTLALLLVGWAAFAACGARRRRSRPWRIG